MSATPATIYEAMTREEMLAVRWRSRDEQTTRRKTLAKIRDRVQSLREQFHEGDAATPDLLLGIDIQSLLLAYEQSRAENTRLRAGNAALRPMRLIVEAVARADPIAMEHDGRCYCIYPGCDYEGYPSGRHRPSCPWVLACKLLGKDTDE